MAQIVEGEPFDAGGGTDARKRLADGIRTPGPGRCHQTCVVNLNRGFYLITLVALQQQYSKVGGGRVSWAGDYELII